MGRRVLAVLLACAGLASGVTGTAARENTILASPDDAWHLCSDTAQQIERSAQLPETMLEAITTVESGRGVAGYGTVRPWPWTIFAEGKGQHFGSKKAAMDAVRALRARGVQSIDVGCMQVNLHYHPGAFTSLEEAFDPTSNISYAASLLQSLKKTHGSWEAAIEHYHSYDPTRRTTYRAKVFNTWNAISQDRTLFRLASEVSLERLGAPGTPVQLIDGMKGPALLETRERRQYAAPTGAALAGLRGAVPPPVYLTSLDDPPPARRAYAGPVVILAVDLSPRPTDRPDPTHASVFGRTTVAAAETGRAAVR